MNDSTLKELWQQVAEKKSCEAKQKELTAQRDTLADRLKKLEKSKLAEQADVDRLEGHSLAAFFYQVIGKMDEKLDILHKALQAGGRENIRLAMKQVVPTYRDPEEVNCQVQNN